MAKLFSNFMLNLLSEKILFMGTGIERNQLQTRVTEGKFEYILAVLPGTEVAELVMGEKQAFYDKYKEKAAIKETPYITIASFTAKEEMEDTIIRWMHRIISTQPSFTAALNNYGGFPPHSIYLRVQPEEAFRLLAKQMEVVSQYISDNGCPPMFLTSRPHMNLAKRISEDVYEKAIMDYAHRSFHAAFEVAQLVLLRYDEQGVPKQVNIFNMQPALQMQVD